TAVVVDARDDRADRSVRAPRGGVGRRARRVRRRDGRPADEPGGRPAAGRGLRLRDGVRHRRHAAPRRLRSDPGGGPAHGRAARHEGGRAKMTDGRIVWTVAKWALTAGAVAVLLAQCRKPRWWLGHLVVRGMNRSHLALTNWGLGHVAIGERFTI